MLSRRQIVKRITALHGKRRPLNITAVMRHSPELIESAYARKDFWGWKRALEEAGIGYDEIEVELLDYVTCQICGRDYGALGAHLVKTHQTTGEEYKEEFPDEFLVCETVRATQMAAHDKRTIPHWEPLWSEYYVLDRIAHIYHLGHQMNHLNILLVDRGLPPACKRYFGGWDQALERIGLDPLDHRRNNEIVWTKDVVIEMIRQRSRECYPLTAIGAAKGTDDPHYKGTSLPQMALELFGTWEAALRAAGIVPEDVGSYHNIRKYPTAASVLKEIGRRERQGLMLNGGALAKTGEDQCLAIAGREFFGSWPGALEAAGLDPGSVDQHKQRIKYKTPAEVVTELQRRLHEGLPVTHLKAQRDDPGLRNAAQRLFGGWPAALDAAGIDLAEIDAPGSPRYLSPEAVLKGIARRVDRGMALKSSALTSGEPAQRDVSLYFSAKRHFGSWSAALEAAGLDPEVVSRRAKYVNPDEVIAELGRRHRTGLSISFMEVEKGEHRDFALTVAARKHCGGWREALEAAGFDPCQLSQIRYLSEDAVVTGIYRRTARGLPMNVSSLLSGQTEHRDAALAQAAKRYFGSWPAALEAAKLDPSLAVKRTTRFRSAADVVAALHKRAEGGLPLSVAQVTKGLDRDIGLVKAASKYFGSWPAALEAAGIDPATVVKRLGRFHSAADVVAALRKRAQTGLPVTCSEVAEGKHRDVALANAARKFCGSWQAALTRAGLKG